MNYKAYTMKKIIVVFASVAAPFVVFAQDADRSLSNEEVFRVSTSILVVGLFMVFILAVAKKIMDYRLKNKITEKGVPENIVASILQTNPKENTNANIKWFALLTGMGAALTIIYYTLPLGIHSLAIMCFCIAASFLGYYFFLQKTEK